MIMSQIRSWSMLLLLAGGTVHTSSAFADSREGIILDPASGNYTVNYCSPDELPGACELQTVTFEPATKISPLLKSHFFLDTSKWTINYQYRIRNKAVSRQPVIQLVLDPVTDVRSATPLPRTLAQTPTDFQALRTQLSTAGTALGTPAQWRGSVYVSTSPPAVRVVWTYKDLSKSQAGLAPGQVQIGYTYSSSHLPGIIAAQLSGKVTTIPSFDDDGPVGSIGAQLEAIEQHDYVTRYAAVPAVAIPVPFDRAELLRRIETQAQSWVSLKILDPVAFAQIDSFIRAAIAALGQGNGAGCAANVSNTRSRLRQIYASLDDALDDWSEPSESPLMTKLAARVLDFDLDYAIRHP